jgi:hypothetical protein
MNTKLMIAIVAALIATPALAEQQFGRDSVYATGKTVSKSSNTPVSTAPARFGRDSVYAIGTKPSTPIKVGNVVPKFGRA